VSPLVDPASIPELAEILRRRLLSKVRIFEGWCQNGDRLLQVVMVQGRPLALAPRMIKTSNASPNPAFQRGTHAAHRSKFNAAWLDLNWDAYYLPHAPPEPGQSLRVVPYRLSAQCQHERLAVPLDWLREQVNAGVAKQIITDTIRWQMGARPRGE
jgi:hypothetical protein